LRGHTAECRPPAQGDDEKVLATVALLCHEEADPQKQDDMRCDADGRTSTKRDRSDVTPAEAKLEMMNLLALLSRGRRPRPDDARTMRVCRRLFAALVLRQLINEVRSGQSGQSGSQRDSKSDAHHHPEASSPWMSSWPLKSLKRPKCGLPHRAAC